MTNFEWVKNLNEDQMAAFITLYRPDCNELCKDAKAGCNWGCKHHSGRDIIRKWLDKDVNDDEEI
ncbi:MAG: hypothetical protein K0R54_2758 [Clostridiaceae bacterium]|jgi:hypothetical protein|nr:hypothetical protein [Clostridiaceae bacterium]MDF2950476.1 hypothetical protein [Anaerocolumna sp.]